MIHNLISLQCIKNNSVSASRGGHEPYCKAQGCIVAPQALKDGGKKQKSLHACQEMHCRLAVVPSWTTRWSLLLINTVVV